MSCRYGCNVYRVLAHSLSLIQANLHPGNVFSHPTHTCHRILVRRRKNKKKIAYNTGLILAFVECFNKYFFVKKKKGLKKNLN